MMVVIFHINGFGAIGVIFEYARKNDFLFLLFINGDLIGNDAIL